jgi:hypothetical protein|tara:strand:+ start:397 stop:1731 length:1335 start_codon:yes stop_codon:yes gene_type:complete
MADLENNLEGIQEAGQPDSKAEKGDSKTVKQGSSDAATIGQGKVDVVKPEENPVDKAVAAQKKAEAGVKVVSNDPQQKNAGKADKADSIKEDEKESSKDVQKSTKMESIKAIVNNMKEMTKEEISSVLGTVSEEEVDESLTKAETARKVVESLKSMDEEAVAKVLEGFNKKEEEADEDEEEVKEEVETSLELESSLVEIEIDDDLSAISEALELSEENAEKAKTIFKAAVSSKVQEVSETLRAQYSEELKTTVETVKGDLAEAVDKYLTYCAEEWTKENELAIERGLRSEMTENFIEGLKTLFVEHYVDVPEDKYNVIDELANRLDEMESKLDGEVQNNMDITEELETLKRVNVISAASSDLTDSQKEKLSSLAEGVEYKTEEDFAEKISEVKNAYFPAEGGQKIVEETLVVEGANEFEVEKTEKVLDPILARYSQAISNHRPL